MSEETILFDQAMPWYKGNLHTHTTLSDGKLPPEEACEFYRSRGYSFLAITDHRTFYKAEEQEGFTLLGGCELDYNDMVARSAWHIIGIGIEGNVPFAPGDKPEKLVQGIREAGGLAVLGHPHWSLLSHNDMMGLDGIFATEIYSGVSYFNSDRGDSSEYVDTCMAKGCPKLLLGVDDTHRYTGDACRAWIMLQSPSLSRRDILASLEKGAFYATEGGPAFKQITLKDGIIRVECDDSARVTFLSDTFWDPNRVTDAKDTPLRSAEYPVKKDDNYVRVQLTAYDGKRSTSQYIPVGR